MSVAVLAVIQAHRSDLLPGATRVDAADVDRDPNHYVIGPLRRSARIDRVVIAAPDTPSHRIFTDLAREWDVDLFLGSEYDVIDRLTLAARHAGAGDQTVIVRLVMNRFYLDIDLVDRQIDLLRATGSDVITLPEDFDIAFGADVMTLACLERAGRALEGSGRAHERFRPWLFIEEHPELFRVATCHEVPSYPREKLTEIRASGLFGERDCSTCSKFTYEIIADALRPSDIVLDIASGDGAGSAILAPRCARLFGCDLDAGVVTEANARGIANALFEVQDGCNLTYADGFFSTIVSSNTLEHVEDDEAMLQSFYRVLQPGGRLILETPILKRRPFNFPLLSSHLREYDKDALVALLARCGFEPERKLGMNRGMYVAWERARESVLIHARKSISPPTA